MRNTCDSSNAVWISAESAFAESRECPKGFSTITREFAVSAPIAARERTMSGNAAGGTAK